MQKVFKHKSEHAHTLWCVCDKPGERPKGCPDTHKAYYRYGGGFITWLNPADLEEVDFPTERQEGFAAIIDEETTFFPCICNPHIRWNGWACPSFTEEVFKEVCEYFSLIEFARETVEVKHLGKVTGVKIQLYFYYREEDKPATKEDCEAWGDIHDGWCALDGWCWDFFTKEEKEQWELKRKEEEEEFCSLT